MSTLNEDDPRLVFQPIEQASVPPAGLIEHLQDRWWSAHPTKGLIWYCIEVSRRRPSIEKGSPQCNKSESIARDIQRRMYPWAEVVFMPSVFRRIDPHDYAS